MDDKELDTHFPNRPPAPQARTAMTLRRPPTRRHLRLEQLPALVRAAGRQVRAAPRQGHQAFRRLEEGHRRAARPAPQARRRAAVCRLASRWRHQLHRVGRL
eukprot:scaffold136182_cov124-Phaeocystis_antarctica.AAC.1